MLPSLGEDDFLGLAMTMGLLSTDGDCRGVVFGVTLALGVDLLFSTAFLAALSALTCAGVFFGVAALTGVRAGVGGALLSDPALLARVGLVMEEADPTDTERKN